ncbi:hypothetical protein FRX31_010718 [Thalictrum thalictroides]|uniref:Uncharacterized protein n=1 Tax=Thalictrum thalictroides TaxID=46969 RepID=A0A7J6WTA2_THATH|nr:hypothetical protein FRX31_010718 [Thalictrum thalictroides]
MTNLLKPAGSDCSNSKVIELSIPNKRQKAQRERRTRESMLKMPSTNDSSKCVMAKRLNSEVSRVDVDLNPNKRQKAQSERRLRESMESVNRDFIQNHQTAQRKIRPREQTQKSTIHKEIR